MFFGLHTLLTIVAFSESVQHINNGQVMKSVSNFIVVEQLIIISGLSYYSLYLNHRHVAPSMEVPGETGAVVFSM